MKIRILVFGAENNRTTARLDEELRFMFSDRLTGGEEITHYSTLTEALPEFAGRFRGIDTVLLLTDISLYADTKRLLAGALKLSMRSSPEIARRTRGTIGDFDSGSEEMTTHCLVPGEGETFCLCDGLYAGFASVSGKQNLLLLPYEKERTTWLLSEQVIPYLNRFYETDIPTDSGLRFRTARLARLLTQSGKQLAVSGTKTAAFIRAAAEQDESLRTLLKFTPSAEARGNVPPVEYAVNLSIAAAELEGCAYGTAMTSAYYNGNDPDSEKRVYIALTDENDSAVREIHSVPGEAIDAFLRRCVCELLDFTEQRIQRSVRDTQELYRGGNDFISRGKLAVLSALVALGAVLCVLVAYFVTEQVRERNAELDAQQEAVASSYLAALEATSEPPAEPPAVSENASSDKAVSEAASGESEPEADAGDTDTSDTDTSDTDEPNTDEPEPDASEEDVVG